MKQSSMSPFPPKAALAVIGGAVASLVFLAPLAGLSPEHPELPASGGPGVVRADGPSDPDEWSSQG
ncbi:hypothetical protein OG897_14675 [Streptomyces sp. NBC_00237]|uniref:hypothetical protein n=1 Tax=Streptomyces sp. NBC_00237 TaxID=2975687 RepID=UPI0022513B4C|nr:hypothetical protein [Streptomyces sp. NBC_00237]MCX5202688.1 hypothetical protein [Streptomyces sp. NBC_00237]